MLSPVFDALTWTNQFADPLAWLVVAAFLLTVGVEYADTDAARYLGVGGWVLFGVFWLTQLSHFAFTQRSIVETVGVLLAIPGSLYVGYLLWNGRDSLFVLTRAVAVMGVLYLHFVSLPWIQQPLIETVTRQTEFVMTLLGFDPTVISGAAVEGASHEPYRSTFEFYDGDHRITYTILIACTGVGSMAIIAGLVLAVRAPPKRKAMGLLVSVPVIYVLNIARNVFIGLSFGKQWMQFAPDLTLSLFGATDPYLVSYFWADRIIAQSLSVVFMVAITFLVVRQTPQVLVIIEDLLYIFTRREWDLQDALDLPQPGETAEAAD